MRNITIGTCAALVLMEASDGNAGTVTGTVSAVITRASDGLTYAAITGTPSGQPACATHAYWMIMNETSETGKRQYAMLITAKVAGTSVTIIGNNTCTRWADGEDINSIELGP